jgi:hypothetical protein
MNAGAPVPGDTYFLAVPCPSHTWRGVERPRRKPPAELPDKSGTCAPSRERAKGRSRSQVRSPLNARISGAPRRGADGLSRRRGAVFGCAPPPPPPSCSSSSWKGPLCSVRAALNYLRNLCAQIDALELRRGLGGPTGSRSSGTTPAGRPSPSRSCPNTSSSYASTTTTVLTCGCSSGGGILAPAS